MRRYTKKKNVSTRQVAEKALSIARKAVSTEETKNNDIGPLTQTVDNTADVSLIPAIPVGTGTSNRIGNKIQVLGFNLNYWVYRNGGSVHALIRVVMVHDTQTISGSVGPAWTDVFTSGLTHSLRNVNSQAKRYKIIYDQTHPLNAAYPSTGLVKKYIPFKHPVLYNNTGFQDIQKNGVYLLLQSSESGTSSPSIQYHIRTLYKDS